ERQRLGLDPNAFAIYTALKPFAREKLTTNQAEAANALFVAHPDYQWNEAEKARLRADLYKLLRLLLGGNAFIEATNSLLKLQRV
ncbi:MAG: hypothetical protein ACLQUY_29100, partial [Ktedonobacterales bacterium]